QVPERLQAGPRQATRRRARLARPQGARHDRGAERPRRLNAAGLTRRREGQDGQRTVEAFTDGVVAIIIIIMVLELKVPHGEDFSALLPLWPVFSSYVLSFIFVGIYWN